MKFMSSSVKYTDVHVDLAVIINLIQKKRPLIEYEVVKVHPFTDHATKVKCWQHGQCLGAIDVNFNRFSKTEDRNIRWLAVFSRNIEKERGQRGVKFTKKPESAAKIAIEVFVKESLANLAEQAHDTIRGTIGGLLHRAHSNYRFALTIPEHHAVEYFVQLKLGETPEPPKMIMDKIDDVVLAKRDVYHIGHNVGKHVDKNNGYGIAPMVDETFLFFDMADTKTASKCSSPDEFPISVQEKFAILKVLEPNQFAKDIGIKFYKDSDDPKTLMYFIVKGETVTY